MDEKTTDPCGSEKEEKIMRSMKQEYGPEKGEEVFYASKSAGKFGDSEDAVQLSGGNVGGLMEQPIPERPSGALSGIDSICDDFNRRFNK
jgi:hypothetical protein